MRLVLAISLIASIASATLAQPADPIDRYQVPPAVSAEARSQLQEVYKRLAQRPTGTRPDSLAEWDRRSAQAETLYGARFNQIVAALKLVTTDDRIGGVPVLRIRRADFKPSRRVLLYIHGGAYTMFSPRTSFSVPATVAASTGVEVISIAYTLAPHATWREVTDQVLAVYQAALATGVPHGSIGVFGDSAGGGLTAGSVLKMRERGLPLPGALWLMSPVTDLTRGGDTYSTLAPADPILSRASSSWSADAYAAPADQNNPYVSPVYGDYSKAYPPTLIQVGTREMLLSDSVREYQAIRGGGHEAVLDVYEGMPHNFQMTITAAPEAQTAIARGAKFFMTHLDYHSGKDPR